MKTHSQVQLNRSSDSFRFLPQMISAMEDLSIHSVNFHHSSLSLCCCSCRDTQLSFDQNLLWMHQHPIWLIEVEEDLFLTPFFQFYQSTRMMMPYNRNTTHQTQWIEEKWDLTLQMIWHHRMHNHPVWLIEVEEDLFITPFIQLYQSTRMILPLLRLWNYHRNTSHQTQWIEEKWDLTLQMIRLYGMLHHPVWLIEVEEDLFLISFIQ